MTTMFLTSGFSRSLTNTIRLGTPADVSKYVCLDGNLAFMAHQAGNISEWKDDDGLWFKRTKKMLKFYADNGIEL